MDQCANGARVPESTVIHTATFESSRWAKAFATVAVHSHSYGGIATVTWTTLLNRYLRTYLMMVRRSYRANFATHYPARRCHDLVAEL